MGGKKPGRERNKRGKEGGMEGGGGAMTPFGCTKKMGGSFFTVHL